MKKLLFLSLCILFFTSQTFAQTRTITGTVIAKDDGEPLPGVSVTVKGTTIGVQTGADGKFSLNIPSAGNKTLTFSFIGYNTVEKAAIGSVLNVTLEVSSKQLGEVLVTGALGVKRQARELGFAATNIDSKSLTQAKSTNIANGLTGKVAGLNVSTNDNGINPSVRFTLRGNRHILGNNFALVVLDGTPISPNDLNSINPDDIADINVLNGAGAAALYGSEASNGALIVTTKRGTATGAPEISYSNTFQLEKISYFPALQHSFGAYGGEGAPYQDLSTGFIIAPVAYENQSYGPAYDGHLTKLGAPVADGSQNMVPYSAPSIDPREAFFVSGKTEQNNLSYSSGDDKNSFFLSANNTNRTGVVPNDTYRRTSIRASGSKTYGMFRADFSAGYTQAHTSTYGKSYQYASTDARTSLLFNIFNTPEEAPLQQFQNLDDKYSSPDGYFNAFGVNPYWIIQRSRKNTRSDVFNGSFKGTLSPTKWLDATYALSDNFGIANYQFYRQEVDFSAFSLTKGRPGLDGQQTIALSGGVPVIPGEVQNISQTGDGSLETGAGPQGYSRLQQDVFLNFHHTFFNDFKTTLLLGNSIFEETYQTLTNTSSNLLVKDFYNVGSILGTPTTTQELEKIRQIAFFGDLTIGYKGFAFIEGTLRNDRDSRLNKGNQSFFYPSIKGTLVFTDAIPALKGNAILNYGKLRASYSKVGDINTRPYSINNTFFATSGFPYGNAGGLSLSNTLNNPNLKPEITKEFEVGADLGFFDNRVNGSITYYDSHTSNQTISITTSPSTGYRNAAINIGELENSGWELKADVQVLTKKDNGIALTLGGNLAINNSKVLSIKDGLNEISIGGYTGAPIKAVVGQPYPVLYGTDVQRDPTGHIIVDAKTGLPTITPGLVPLGNTNAKYILGLTQALSYKFVTLTVVSDFRTGNVIYNQSLSSATSAGVSALSASNNRQPFVFPNSVIQTAPGVYTPNTSVSTNDGAYNFWQTSDYYNAISTYVTSAAFWKLREANLSFDLSSLIKKSEFAGKYIKRGSFAIVGRNLLMWRPKSNNWTDPEFSAGSVNGSFGNAVGITNNDQTPPTRIFGATLNLTF